MTVWRRRKVDARLPAVKHFFAAAGLLLLFPGLALAQVTVNPAALQQLAGIIAPPRFSPPMAAPVAHYVKPPHRAMVAARRPAAPVRQAAIRVVAPPAPRVSPASAKSLPAKPLTPVSVAFAPGSAALPPGAAAVLQPFCTARGQVAVDARAPTDPTDPSAAMRLSLSRAFAVQQALTACGVPPQNILPRADGDVPGRNEDETVVGSSGAKE